MVFDNITTDLADNSILLTYKTIDELDRHGYYCGVIVSDIEGVWGTIEVLGDLEENQFEAPIDEDIHVHNGVYCLSLDDQMPCVYRDGKFICTKYGFEYDEMDVRNTIENSLMSLAQEAEENNIRAVVGQKLYDNIEDEDEDSWEEYDEDWD